MLGLESWGGSGGILAAQDSLNLWQLGQSSSRPQRPGGRGRALADPAPAGKALASASSLQSLGYQLSSSPIGL